MLDMDAQYSLSDEATAKYMAEARIDAVASAQQAANLYAKVQPLILAGHQLLWDCSGADRSSFELVATSSDPEDKDL